MRSAQTYIEIVHDRGKRKLPLQRVYRNLQKRDLFLAAYAKLYSNKGAMTKGVNPNTPADTTAKKWIKIVWRARCDGNAPGGFGGGRLRASC